MKYIILLVLVFSVLGCVKKKSDTSSGRTIQQQPVMTNRATSSTTPNTKTAAKKGNASALLTNFDTREFNQAKITFLGGKNINSVRQPFTIDRNWDFGGFALNPDLEGPAGDVRIKIGEHIFKTKTGLGSDYLAKSLNNSAYKNAGFTGTIPYLELTPGRHKMELIVFTIAGTQRLASESIDVIVKEIEF